MSMRVIVAHLTYFESYIGGGAHGKSREDI